MRERAQLKATRRGLLDVITLGPVNESAEGQTAVRSLWTSPDLWLTGMEWWCARRERPCV